MKSRLISKYKAQAWGLDLMVAVFIFSIALTVFFVFSLNQPNEGNENLEYLFYDGKIIARSILSEGVPIDWNPLNVVSVGILSDDKINLTKLERFRDMAINLNDYERTKQLFNTKYDYYFFLDKPMKINGDDDVDGIGKPGVTRDTVSSNAENLIKITRYTIYEYEPITAYVYVWE